MKEQIIADLGNNYRASDELVLENIIEDISSQALFISNRKSIEGLEFEIKEAVKTIYLRRGTEDVISLGESGRNASYTDALKKLRTDLINNGKRYIK